MLKATLKSLLAHKRRLVLTSIAVVIGVAFMAGTFVLTDTIKNSINGIFSQTAAGKAVIVRGVQSFSSSGVGAGGGGGGLGGNTRPLVPETLLPTVKSVPGVAAADPLVEGTVILSRNGKAIGSAQAPTIALTWFTDRSLSSLDLKSGSPPQQSGQLAIDAKTASDDHIKIGDTLTVTGNLGPQPFTVTGIVTFGSQETVAGATLAIFDTATGQQIAGKPGYYTEIDVAASGGVSEDQLANRIGAVLPPHYEAVTGVTAAAQMASSVDNLFNAINDFLLAFGFLALFVGAFVIFNTFSIIVGQRTRELALFRAVGAGRGQVILSILGEALATGLVGSAIGLGAGIGLAILLTHLLKNSFSLGTTHLQIESRTVIVSLVVGTLVTLASAILPSLRASRIPPVVAMHEDIPTTDASLRRRLVIGAVWLVVGIAVLVVGLTGTKSIAKVGIGALISFIGVAILLPLIATPLARLIGSPARPLGITGRLGRENAARNPRRTAATASALMIGVAIVAAIATIAASALASFDAVFNDEFTASYVVSSTGADFPQAATEQALRQAPGVTALSGFEALTWHLKQTAKTVDGIDGTEGPQVLKIVMVSGSAGALAQGQLLVDETTATADHLKVGGTVTMNFDITGKQTFTIGGIYQDSSLLSDHYVLATAVLAQNTNQLRDQFVLVKTTSVSGQEESALKRAMSAYPNLKIENATQFKADQEKSIRSALTFIYVLLVLASIVSVFGIVNTMALSVLERTREIGLLRSVGMIRRQSHAMILIESVIVTLLGAVTGLVVGIALGTAMVHAIIGGPGSPVVLRFPWVTIVVVLIITAIFGLLAGLFPARRAGRLDVLRAITAV
ncbi:MAG TPA: FtsX-like permease family protein [Actinomycetota bacterium]|nr:FtsX-like permease family protein [Actinomycetota bacterium]